MVKKYPLDIDGVRFGHMVERDGYTTTLTPVTLQSVKTMDGTIHAAVGFRSSLTAVLNPQPQEDLAVFCRACLGGPVYVHYYSQQLGTEVNELMQVSALSATYLSRCLARGKRWSDPGSVTFEGVALYAGR